MRFPEMLAALRDLPERSVVLMHTSCHNPTGADLIREQWSNLIPVFRVRQLVPFLDLAYQGFSDGLDEDAMAVRPLEAAGLQFLVAVSFSKNFRLCGERCGALSIVCGDRREAASVPAQLKTAVRRNYSTPPLQGAQIVSTALNPSVLRARWRDEVAEMRPRIRAMCQGLAAALTQRSNVARDFGFLLTQRGMFSYSGLAPPEVYVTPTGRICLAGLTTANLHYVADAMAEVLVPCSLPATAPA